MQTLFSGWLQWWCLLWVTCRSVICFPNRINWHYQFIAIQTFYTFLLWQHKIVYQSKLETKTSGQDWKQQHALTFTVYQSLQHPSLLLHRLWDWARLLLTICFRSQSSQSKWSNSNCNIWGMIFSQRKRQTYIETDNKWLVFYITITIWEKETGLP